MDESVVKEFEQQQVGKLKLSQAIRIGAKLRPQGFEGVFGQRQDGTSCALLAGYEAIHGAIPDDLMSAGLAEWADNIIGQNATLMVIYRNDDLRWTREKIADWLESEGL